MKTLLSAVVAALVGAGAAVGVMVSGVVEPEDTKPIASKPEVDRDDEITGVDHSDEIAELRLQLDALRAQNSVKDSSAPEIDPAEFAAMKATVDGLSKKAESGVVAPKIDTNEAGEIVVEGGFDTAVRDVMTRVAEEKEEERRLKRQEDRLTKLENGKTSIAEVIPQFLSSQAERFGLDETQITQCSTLMVNHAQMIMDLRSNAAGQKIDGQEVDMDALKQSMEDLNVTTLSALSAVVDAETAEKLASSANRMARGGGDKGGDNGGRRNGGNRRNR
ncbi:MAG: hypothetical protein ACYTDT_03565 [Planctomycetota bacterium]|jgi:hypothetical protein